MRPYSTSFISFIIQSFQLKFSTWHYCWSSSCSMIMRLDSNSKRFPQIDQSCSAVKKDTRVTCDDWLLLHNVNKVTQIGKPTAFVFLHFKTIKKQTFLADIGRVKFFSNGDVSSHEKLKLNILCCSNPPARNITFRNKSCNRNWRSPDTQPSKNWSNRNTMLFSQMAEKSL